MGMYTWLSEQEFKEYSKVSDTEINEILQEVRLIMPEWYISERFYSERVSVFKKPLKKVTYSVYERIGKDEEVRYQSSAFDKPTILNLLYGLYMGYNRFLK